MEVLNDYAPSGMQFQDQELYRLLPFAFQAVRSLVRQYRPDTVLVPAYEGGHPDHDTCSFLGALLRHEFGLPVWKMPLYHRSQVGELRCQQFLLPNGTERAIILNFAQKQLREDVIATYASQTDIRDFVSKGVELYRPQVDYDYSKPPHPGPVNYEVWEWPITCAEVCRAFENCAHLVESVKPASFTGCSGAALAQTSVASAGLGTKRKLAALPRASWAKAVVRAQQLLLRGSRPASRCGNSSTST